MKRINLILIVGIILSLIFSLTFFILENKLSNEGKFCPVIISGDGIPIGEGEITGPSGIVYVEIEPGVYTPKE